jgi:hypothetical protein
MNTPRSRRVAQWPLLMLLLLYALLAGGYFVLRYGGRWSDSDTANLTLATAAVAVEGTLVPSRGLYGLGFAYQALSAFVLCVSGLSLAQLQFAVYPLLAAGLASIAFVLYRELTGEAIMGALAAFLLFLQPDFLFAIFRGSHEKVTWLAALLALYLLANSFSQTGRLSRLIPQVLLFYLAVLALASSNALFGSSFIIALALSLATGFVLLRLLHLDEGIAARTVVRLTYVLLSALVLWFVLVFHLYTPAMRLLLDLKHVVDRAVAVILGIQARVDPYAAVTRGWVSRSAYLGLTLPTWTAAAASFATWVYLGWQMLRGRRVLAPAAQQLMWLLYGAFGLQLAAAVALDQTGAISGNLQVRLFPAVMVVVFPMITWGMVHLWRGSMRPQPTRWLAALLCVGVLWASAASLLKATNDPWLSNYLNLWTIHEEQAVRWVEGHVQHESVWLGLSGIRVASRAVADGFGNESHNRPDTWIVDAETRALLLSSADAMLSLKTGVPLPDVRGEHRTYDNGEAWMYQKRPRTPYQR